MQGIKLNLNHTAYYKLGNAYREQKKYAEAQMAYRQAIKLNPKYDKAYISLGLAYY